MSEQDGTVHSLADQMMKRMATGGPVTHEALATACRTKAIEMISMGHDPSSPEIQLLMDRHNQHAKAHEDQQVAENLAIVNRQMAAQEAAELEEAVQQPVVSMSDLYKRAGKPMNPGESFEPRPR